MSDNSVAKIILSDQERKAAQDRIRLAQRATPEQAQADSGFRTQAIQFIEEQCARESEMVRGRAIPPGQVAKLSHSLQSHDFVRFATAIESCDLDIVGDDNEFMPVTCNLSETCRIARTLAEVQDATSKWFGWGSWP